MPATSLEDLQQQIAQREQELERLRQELQARQAHLDTLMHRKEQLHSELRQVEEEIASLGIATLAPKEQPQSATASMARTQPASNGTPKAARKPARLKSAGKKKSAKAAPSSKAARTGSSSQSEKQPSLREILTGILKGSRKLLFGSELARQALATGYRSNSQNFINTVTALLTKMDAVEHITGQGYRLRRKA
jgi:chromosome segregation ATPase